MVECTIETIVAVRDYMIDSLLGGIDCPNGNIGTYKWELGNGKSIRLRVEVVDERNPFNSNSNAC